MATSRLLPLLVTTDLQADPASVKRTRSVQHYAIDLARKLGTQVEVAHVANLAEIAQIPQAANVILKTQKQELENLVNPFQEVSRARFLVGHPATAITKLATQKNRHFLLVQGTSGRTGIPRALLGSVAEEVIRSARIPVMTVGPQAQKSGPSERTPILLLATDLTKTSAPAEKWAGNLAKKIGARIHAVHHLQSSFHPVIKTALSSPSANQELKSVLASLHQDAVRALEKRARSFQKAGIECTWSLLETPGSSTESGAETLIREARSQKASLVVMGTHSRGLLLGGFLGSTCRAVILGAPVPVITVR
jgi:nucleotide-binding universal stress UspA family protein